MGWWTNCIAHEWEKTKFPKCSAIDKSKSLEASAPAHIHIRKSLCIWVEKTSDDIENIARAQMIHRMSDRDNRSVSMATISVTERTTIYFFVLKFGERVRKWMCKLTVSVPFSVFRTVTKIHDNSNERKSGWTKLPNSVRMKFKFESPSFLWRFIRFDRMPAKQIDDKCCF